MLGNYWSLVRSGTGVGRSGGKGGGGGGGGGGGHHFNGKIEHLGVAKYWWDSLAYCVASGACSDCTMAMSTSLGKY